MKPGLITNKISLAAVALVLLSTATLLLIFINDYPLNKISLAPATLIFFASLVLIQKWRKGFLARKKMTGTAKSNDEPGRPVPQRIHEPTIPYKILAENFERISDAFIALDRNWRYTYMNKKAGEIFNRQPGKIIGNHIWTEFPESVDGPFFKAFHKAMETQQYIYLEEFYPPYGLWLKNHIYPSSEGLSVFFCDITESKKAEQKIATFNRLHFFISHIHHIIARAADEITLLKDVCTIAIETGKFKMAWIGMINDETKKIIPIAQESEEPDHLPGTKLSAGKELYDWNASAPALPGGKYILYNDIETDPGIDSWRTEALQRNYHSCIALPLKKSGKVVGIFNLYAGTKNFFDNEEIILLDETAEDISFALEVIEKERLRKKAEEAVLESERRYQTLTEVCPVGIFRTDTAGYTTYVNPRWSEISGMAFQDALGIGWLTAVHEEDKSELLNGWNKAKEVHGISVSEYRIIHPDGTIRWMSGQANPEWNLENQIIGYVGTVTDITERKKSEEEIKKANERFKMIALATNDAVFELGIQNGESWYNDAFLELFDGDMATGNLRQDITNWISKLHPGDKEKVTSKMVTAYTGGFSAGAAEFRFQKANGQYGIFYNRYFITRDESGKAVRIIGSMTDITELKEVEEQLRASEEKYRTLFFHNPMACWVSDKESSDILDVNDAAISHYGYSRPEFLSMKIKQLLSLDEYEKYLKIKHSGGIPVAGNIGVWHHLKKDGTEIDVELKVHDIIYNNIPCRITLANDVTEQRKAEEKIKAANERFELIAKATNDVIWDCNLVTGELWWNDNYYDLFGYENRFALTDTLSWNKRIHPDDRERVIQGIQQAVDSGESFWYDEYRYLKKDGTIVFIYDRGFILHDECNKPYRMMGSMLNVTAIKKAQDEIIKEKNLSDSVINSLPGVFYLFNKEGKYLRWNKNLEKVTMYTAEEIRNIHPLGFFEGEDKELIAERIADTFNFGETKVQAGLVCKNKVKIPYYFTGIAIDYEGNPCLLGVGIDFSERVKAQEKIEQASRQLSQLAVHLQTIREEERKRIGREIHDELGQQLTAIKMDIAWLDKKTPEESTSLKNKLKNVIQLLDGSNISIRRILSELRPGILEDHGLLEAVQWLGRQFTANTGIPVKFTSTITEIRSSTPVANCIFRAYQEAYTNITRYAKASGVSTSLNIVNDKIMIIIEDDGAGFDATQAQNGKSFGILGMKERVLSLGGTFAIISSPAKGTKIIITLPADISKNN